MSALDEVPLPAALLCDSALQHNAGAMAEYVAARGMLLAPHVKTHMSPELWRLQQRHGAVAATVATAAQLAAMADAGARRLLVANEMVTAADLAVLCQVRRAGADVMVFVDSVAGVERMDAGLARSGPELDALDVLIDFGVADRRTGVRTADEALTVAAAVANSRMLRLRGLAGYEGILWPEPEAVRATRTVEYLDDAVAAIERLLDSDLLPAAPARPAGHADPSDLWRGGPLASFGGSDLYPAVADRVRAAFPAEQLRVVLRSGCYLPHDHGRYRRAQQTVTAHHPLPVFRPALEVWGAVLSIPEPGLVVVGAGRRDMSYDDAPPVTILHARDGQVRSMPEIAPTAMYDQHSVLRVDQRDDGQPVPPLAVGDLVAFGASHPCTTFDKWRELTVVDDDRRPLSRVRTLFH
ncbi:alanine racemase [Microbacterium sp. USHLN186]|uniref:alanine racemase n=1 Tax=Microbacterium sp. USHLN186 TaxID=3081286 RepID=UPI003019709D